ncbi:MAG: FtsX-like permease family protein, partial [Pseudomonadota bacterium]
AVLNGRKRAFTVVGTAMSPEFVYVMAPGAMMPDDRRYGVIWLPEQTLAAAFDLDGAFNSVALALSREADVDAVLEAVDDVLDRYGGTGSIARADQMSNWFVMNELDEMETMATIMPTIFLLVAAFLVNVVLVRLIAVERSEIGLMKANGYSNTAVAWHYLKLVSVIALIGVVLGWALGGSLGRWGAGIYQDLFRLPVFVFSMQPSVYAGSAAVALATAWIGTIGGVARVVRLSPAEAMRPAQPTAYRPRREQRARARRWPDQATRIVLRQIARAPVRASGAVVGLSASIAVLVLALQWIDSIAALVNTQYFEAQHQDYSISLVEPRTAATEYDFRHLPSVLGTEASRSVPVWFSNGSRKHRGGLQGVPRNAWLQPVHDAREGPLEVPPDGLLLGRSLAEKLGVTTGDTVHVEVLTGTRPERDVVVAGLAESYMGMPAWTSLAALNRLVGDGPAIQQVLLAVDVAEEAELLARLKDLPIVTGISSRRAAVDMFQDTIQEMISVYVGFYVVFALMLGFGVSYNNARITLSENGRDLATLRVLGMTRGEIAYICLAETALLALVAIPVGYLLGYGLAALMATAFSNELFRVPLVVTPAVFGKATLVALGATFLSLLIVRARLDRLDLIGVLKTRE